MILLIIVPCVLLFVYAWRRRRKYLQGTLPPEAVGVWPVIGHLHLWMRGLFWRRLLDIQKGCLKKGGITYMYSGTNSSYTYYGLSDPQDCHKVASLSDQKLFLLDDSITTIFGEGLPTSSVWKSHRQLLETVFEQINYLEVCNREARSLLARISERSGKGMFDQLHFLQQTTLRILFETIFGVNEQSNCATPGIIEKYGSSLQTISRVLFERYQSFFKHSKLFYNCSRLKRKQNEHRNIIKTISNEIITSRRTEKNEEIAKDTIKNTEGTSCLLDGLLQLQSQELYPEEQVADEVNAMMYSGYETIANSLTFVMVMLGSHSAVQDKVFMEIENVIDKIEEDIHMDQLAKLLYLEAVIKETLRLYPAVPTVSRTLTAPTEIKKYTLDPGSQCLLFIYAMNRHSSWGEDREMFRPERWQDGTSLPNRGFSTFGMGLRSCIGQKIAMNVMKIILVHLLQEYRVISDYSKVAVDHRLLLTPVSGTNIALERRKCTEVQEN